MNRFERRPLPAGEAQLEYGGSDYRVLKTGGFVRCAVTGKPIPLDDLKYWSAERQEAYEGPAAVMERLRQLGQAGQNR